MLPAGLDCSSPAATLGPRLELDTAKRAATISARELDMAIVADVYADATLAVDDDRQD